MGLVVALFVDLIVVEEMAVNLIVDLFEELVVFEVLVVDCSHRVCCSRRVLFPLCTVSTVRLVVDVVEVVDLIVEWVVCLVVLVLDLLKLVVRPCCGCSPDLRRRCWSGEMICICKEKSANKQGKPYRSRSSGQKSWVKQQISCIKPQKINK